MITDASSCSTGSIVVRNESTTATATCLYWSGLDASTTLVTWSTARLRCQQLGGQLATFEDLTVGQTQLEQVFRRWTAGVDSGAAALKAWVGLARSVYQWVTGKYYN